MNHLLASTQWLRNNLNTIDNSIINAIALVINNATSLKGTAWLVSEKHLITNAHVISGANSSNIYLVFLDNTAHTPINIFSDPLVDLAVLELDNKLSISPLKIDLKNLSVGSRISTWGHPLGYSGPAPILTVGYLSGFEALNVSGKSIRRLILNAAINPGNSGGPILEYGEHSVLGVAVAKHAPITPTLQSAMDALASNRTGVSYKASDAQGNPINLSESQVVAEILKYFRSLTQVVIGQAIPAEDIVKFLNDNRIPWIENKRSYLSNFIKAIRGQ